MTRFPDVFKKATGEHLYPGTLNVKIDRKIKIQHDFKILGIEIDEPEQDLLFEKCLINGIKAYRIRPYDLKGGGGHEDEILEITSAWWIPNAEPDSEVEVAFFKGEQLC